MVILIALAGFSVMEGHPAKAKFLTVSERHEVQRRLEKDQMSLPNEFGMAYLFDALKDWKIWVHMFINIGIYTPL